MSDTAPEKDTTEPPAEPRLVINVDDALRGLREARDEKGADYIYQKPDPSHTTCVYCWEIDGQVQPQCIVGYALAKLGVPPELMYELANEVSAYALAEKLRPRGYHITRTAVFVLRAAQCVQDAAVGTGERPPDNQINWGAAVAAAESEAERWKQLAAEDG